MNAATTAPRASVSLMPRTPWPPRPWRLNVVELGALAVAARVTNSSTASSRATSQLTTPSSAFLSFMPRTPAVARPIGRTSSSVKRIVMPLLRHHEDVVVAVGLDHPHQLVAVVEVDGDEAGPQRRVVLAELASSSPCPLLVAKNRYAPSS